MPSNQTGIEMGYLAGKYPGQIGHLFSPGAERGPFPHLGVTYALDNGAWPAFISGNPWDCAAWCELLDWAASSGTRPRWILMPDVVGDREQTIDRWHQFQDNLSARFHRDIPLAFAAQNGMQPSDVPKDASVVFLGGTTEWKWSSLTEWCGSFPRVHVGRVNGLRGLRLSAAAGAESCDGTGFGRTRRQWMELAQFMAEQAGEVNHGTQTSWFSGSTSDETEPGLSCSGTDAQAPHGEGS